MKACILIKTSPGLQASVCEAMEEIPAVKAVFPVVGRTDIVVSLAVTNFLDLIKVIEKAKKQEGVTATETLVEMEEME